METEIPIFINFYKIIYFGKSFERGFDENITTLIEMPVVYLTLEACSGVVQLTK